MCPTCGGYFPYKRGTSGGRLYITPATVSTRRSGRYRYTTYGRPGPSTRAVRVYYPQYGGTWFRCPDPWHEHCRADDYWGFRNPSQEQSRRTTPPRPSTERPGRAEVERRHQAKALRHKARQGKARR